MYFLMLIIVAHHYLKMQTSKSEIDRVSREPCCLCLCSEMPPIVSQISHLKTFHVRSDAASEGKSTNLI